ncbi:SWI/SNF chromatin remodeling complex component [Geopyxis carbonaria]|nr:SWI/SNF chromatin remodeling complex component [Geopyxis carbonaria]
MTSSASSSSSNVATPATSLDTDYADTKPVVDDEAVEAPKTELHSRLAYLIKQSGVYVSIIAEKLERQQQDLKIAADRADAKAAAEAEKNPTEVKTEVTSGRRSTRRTTAQDAPAPAAGKKKRGRPTGKAKGPAIPDYFKQDDLKGQKSAAGALAEAAKTEKDVKFGEQKGLRPATQPKLVTGGIMKDYQLEGLYWLVSLYENGLNGILADEMGLGKTLQTISFLAFLREKKVWGPFLIAAPVSTLSNWVDEIERFAPEMNSVLYHGTPEQRADIRNTRLNKLGPDFPIVCTSYDIIMRDRKYLQKFKWKYIIIDEGHRIKNLECKLIKELKSYDSANRLLLTGTPLQNNLSELWSLLNFLLPEVFDDLYFFQDFFNFSKLKDGDKGSHQEFIEEEKKSNLVGSLHMLLKPFLLRRVKTDVMKELPPKREYILYAPLTETQKELYGKLLDHDARGWLLEKLIGGLKDPNNKKRKFLDVRTETPRKRSKSPSGAPMSEDKSIKRHRKAKAISYEEISDDEYFTKIEEEDALESEVEVELDDYQKGVIQAMRQVGNKKLQNLLMQLRQTCNSPHMFYWPWNHEKGEVPDEQIITESGKMMLLERLVPALFARGHKVLIFSQFSTMLDIIQDWAAELHGWEVCRIDGSTPQDFRRAQIKSFNTDPNYKIFLLSTRAGGLGINLTASDTVILFDSDWNPQVDLQAQDRAHRIGQKNPVVVYRLATTATVEQTLLDKADGKRRLEKLVIQNGKFKDLVKSSKGSDDMRAPEDELSEILLKEDFQKVNVVQQGQQVLTDEELETLLDRSPEAFAKKDVVSRGTGAVKVV